MKRLHVALGVVDIHASILEYTNRLGQKPVVTIKHTYALFRTDILNISIRQVATSEIGLRHLGWESTDYQEFKEETDCNGFVWEYFSKEAQIKEILDSWPDSKKRNAYLFNSDNSDCV